MTKKANTLPTDQSQTPESGSFATGFFLGILGGAIGTLLFSTEKGRDILQKIRTEFEPHLAEVAESAEVQALVEEYEVVKDEIAHTVTEAQKKFPKFSARQKKS